MTIRDIPTLNAFLNGVATIFIVAGYICVRTGRTAAHRACMLTAAAVSGAFLVGYVAHKVAVHGVHTPFGGTGAIRGVYYAMLASHVLLAMVIALLVPWTFSLAVRGQIDRHRRWARWTLPLWLYVSVTGVLVYCFLYCWWPAAG